LTLLAASAGAAARTTQPTATISSATLRSAVAARTADKRALTRDSSRLTTCLRTDFGHCGGQRITVARRRAKLAAAERYVLDLSARIARRHRFSGISSSSITAAPTLTVSGQTLSWEPVSGVSSFVLARKVPNQPDEYSTIGGTTITPSSVPGTTVHYSIRTNVSNSAWAKEVSIAYPAAVTPPTESKSESPTGVGSGSGGTGGGSTSATGKGTSGTSSSSSGGDSSGSSTSSAPFEMGIVAGSALMYELPFIEKLGAHTARMEFAIDTPASQIVPIAEAYARAGIRPLLLATFDGTIPSSAEARNLGAWAAAVGPGGSAWKGKTFPAGTAVTSIEFGNETSYSYQYANDSEAGYATRAQEYAIRFKEAHESIQAADPSVGLLAQGDPGNAPGTTWMDNMFKAVPGFGQLVAGWTVHPYGPNWQSIMDEVVSSAQADGAPSSIPLDVTEWGLSTDNGRCLSNNYGFNACMTYQEAATTLESTVAAMRARYGTRLATVYLYEAHDLKATGTSTEREAYFGALQSNEAPKGAYTTAVESLLSTNP
jgi:hypothetical protein